MGPTREHPGAQQYHTRKPGPPNRKQEINIQFQQLLDSVLLTTCLFVAYKTRAFVAAVFPFIPPIESFGVFLWTIPIVMPFGPLLLDLHGVYESPLRKRILATTRQIALSLFWLGILVVACSLLLRLYLDSRAFLLLFLLLGQIAVTVRHAVTATYLRRRARNAQYRERVLLVGSHEELTSFSVPDDALVELEIVERINLDRQPISDLIKAMHYHSVGRVIFVAEHTALGRVEQAISACEIEGVEAWLLADFIRTSIARPSVEALGQRPVLVFRSTPELPWALFAKRLIDLVGSMIGILVCAPVCLLVAVLIRTTSPGKAIFSQRRCGKHGKAFWMYKFRTMHSDAEQRRHELELLNQMSGPVFKLADDPRITPVGRWLRRYSIDELPQLINVLAGDMSLVGPRPLPVYEVENFEDLAQRRRLSVQPGLTCLWQISGRSSLTNFADWVKLDLEYIDRWSLWLDLRILAQTVPAVLLARGAR